MSYWLLKSEPTAYSIEDLEHEGRTPWDGVRNYQARNFMRDSMKQGDVIFFYHSNVSEPGIVGEGTVCSEAYPDKTAFDVKDPHYDPRSKPEAPHWYLVDICYSITYTRTLTLDLLRSKRTLRDMLILRRGNRLSVTPVSASHAKILRQMAR